MVRVIAFDVNETLLDLRALDGAFEDLFGSPAMRTQWFAQMLQLSFVGGLTGSYVDFSAAQRGALQMLAKLTARSASKKREDGLSPWPSRLLRWRGPGRSHLVAAARERHQLLAHLLGLGVGEERQLQVGVLASRRLDDDLGQPRQAGQQRTAQVDRLDPVEPHLPVLAEEHAGAQLDQRLPDPEPREPPRQFGSRNRQAVTHPHVVRHAPSISPAAGRRHAVTDHVERGHGVCAGGGRSCTSMVVGVCHVG